ncbi:MAG TPA: hypothetical protein VE775_09635, partial [Pyrinomonadaceae bacterium]|nr:hypothetical protein [Pyrinomonadaceae bacterium]
MPQDTTKGRAGQASAALACVHRATARSLRTIFKDGSSHKDGRTRVTLHLNRMARAAGIDPTGFQIADRWKLYLRAARAQNRASQLGDSTHAAQVQIAVTHAVMTITRAREREREREQRERGQHAQAQIETIRVNTKCNSYAVFGALDGDEVEAVAAPLADLRAGDLVSLWDADERTWLLGRFVG